MNTTLTVIIVVIVVVLLAAGLLAWNAQRRARLRQRFGPEYDRAIADHGSRREAEKELQAREERHRQLDIRPLDPQAREAYRTGWAAVQEHFVDTPADALSDADRLIRRVMSDRGYGTLGYEQRVATLSVEHARTLEHYRAAHDISTRAAAKEASTEELRQGMVHYRALFQELLVVDDSGSGTGAQPARPRPEEVRGAEPGVRSGEPAAPREPEVQRETEGGPQARPQTQAGPQPGPGTPQQRSEP